MTAADFRPSGELTTIASAITIARVEQLELWTAAQEPAASVELARVAVACDRAASSPATLEQTELDTCALLYLRAARSDNTRRAYDCDWRLFERWCAERGERALPALPTTLARYLTHLAQAGRKASTIRRARKAIGVLHAQHGLPRPDHDARIRTLERGIGRVHGNREEGATPVLLPDLERMVHALGETVRDARDRALLLLGFAGAFRGSELVGLDVSDIEPIAAGLRVHLRRSKEDQLGRGTTTTVLHGHNPALCPVAALSAWITQLPADGPIFRALHGANISDQRLKARAVTRAVERAAKLAGLQTRYSSHSLRSGLATSAHIDGRNLRDIQAHGRWQDARSLSRYIHVSADASHRALAGLL